MVGGAAGRQRGRFGSWWSGTDAPELSLEEELRAAIGLKLGDEVTFEIGGESLTARLTNARLVHWDSFRPNFFLVLSPGEVEHYRADLHHELARRPGRSGA